MSQPTVAVLGASSDRGKFGNIAVRAHLQQGYRVFPVNPKGGTIEGLETYRSLSDIPETLNRITVYLPPAVLVSTLDEIAATPHDELYLNPGTDAPEVLERATELGLDPIRACSVVDIGASPGDFSD